jgi:glycosyltransferase involved in cell wall biosynthesis
VVETFKSLGSNYKLKIFGSGIDEKRLKKIAKAYDNIEFLGRVDEKEKARLYSKALAFINPQEEDFGITPVESMASGRPVIAYKKGGATETIIEGETGIFFKEQNINSLGEAIKSYTNHNFNPEQIREHALFFSKERFKKEMSDFISEHVNK